MRAWNSFANGVKLLSNSSFLAASLNFPQSDFDTLFPIEKKEGPPL